MPARLEPRRTNYHPRVGYADHSVRKHVFLVPASIPANPWGKAYAFGLALGIQQLVEDRALALRVHIREIHAKIRESLGQSISIVELGKRKNGGPHSSITITKFDDGKEFLRGFIFGYRIKLEPRFQNF